MSVAKVYRYDTARALKAIEDAHRDDIASLEVEGWNLWPAFRLLVSDALSTPEGVSYPQGWKRLRRAVTTVGLGLRSLAQLAQLVVKRERDRVMVRTVNYSRRDELDGKLYCVFFDQLVQDLGRERFLVSEGRCLSDEYAANVPNRVDFHDDVIELLGPLFQLWLGRRATSVAQALEPAARRISPEAATGLTPLVRNFVSRYHAWRLIYRLIKPRAVVVSIAYGWRVPELCALKSLGIPVLELQHGQMTDRDVPYAYARSLAPLKPRMALPDKLLVFSDDQRSVLEDDGFWTGSLGVVGSPRLHAYLLRRLTPYPFDPGVRSVLVSSSMLDPIPSDLRRFIAGYLARHPEPACRFYVRPHPVEDLAPWRALVEQHPRHVVLPDAGETLYRLLAGADVQLGVYTTCLQEGLYWGVPVYVLESHPFSSYEQSLVERGGARLIKPDYDGAFEPFEVPARERDRYLRPLDLDRVREELFHERSRARRAVDHQPREAAPCR